MSIFGTLTGQPQVEAAVIQTLTVWMPTYLAEVERQAALPKRRLTRPPTPESIYGSADFDSWQEDQLPGIVVVANPIDDVEYRASAGYGQNYEVQVGALVIGTSEHESRLLAGHMGTAIAAAIIQNGSLGGISRRTRMVTSPKVTLPEGADDRWIHLCAATFHVFVEPTMTDQAGPVAPTPQDSSQYGGDPEAPFTDWPTVTSTDLTVIADPIGS